jgi:hypothetical protein
MELTGLPVTIAIKNVPLEQLPAALKLTGDLLAKQMRAQGIEPKDVEPGGVFTCPVCEFEHPISAVQT